MRTPRTHLDGALHSRTIEKRMAAAKKAKTSRLLRIL
jgi:hypothetical protein